MIHLIFVLILIYIITMYIGCVVYIRVNTKKKDMEKILATQHETIKKYWSIIEELTDELDIDINDIQNDYECYSNR